MSKPVVAVVVVVVARLVIQHTTYIQEVRLVSFILQKNLKESSSV